MAPFFERESPPDFCDLDDELWATRGSGASALRASLGWATNTADVDALIDFVATFAQCRGADIGPPPEHARQRGPDSP